MIVKNISVHTPIMKFLASQFFSYPNIYEEKGGPLFRLGFNSLENNQT